MGLPGLKAGRPRLLPAAGRQLVLGGGGFVSRLMHEVREKRGYAYSAYSYFEPRRELGPPDWPADQGQPDRRGDRGGQPDLKGFLDAGPSDEELAAARDNIVNGFGLRLDSNRKVPAMSR